MAKIACVLADGFEDSEFKDPYDAFSQKGHHIDIISVQAGKPIVGKKGKVKVQPQLTVDKVRPEDYDALFIPGGFSPDVLRADQKMVDFVRRFDELGKPVLAICHAAQLLITAERVRG